MTKSFSEFDHFAMQAAIQEAKKAFALGEVPIGAVLAQNNTIIARAHNRVETTKDATNHAEMLCLKEGYRIKQDWRLQDTTLYVTMEPCSMCAGAMILSRVNRVVYGQKELRHGAHVSWGNTLYKEHPIHNIIVESGLMADVAKELMQTFFKQRRKENKCKMKS